MNIFVLDENPKLCAQYHYDTHIRKMLIEYAQLLSGAWRVMEGEKYIFFEKGKRKIHYKLRNHMELEPNLYKVSHLNHPCSIWARESAGNYVWLYNLLKYVAEEYTYRFGTPHKTFNVIPYLENIPPSLENIGFYKTPFAQAIPDHLKSDNPVLSYRKLYRTEKAHLMEYTKREIPKFLK